MKNLEIDSKKDNNLIFLNLRFIKVDFIALRKMFNDTLLLIWNDKDEKNFMPMKWVDYLNTITGMIIIDKGTPISAWKILLWKKLEK